MSQTRDTATLEKIYEEFGVEPYFEFDNTANAASVDIDSILFEEMYKEAKKVEVSDEEAEQILFELTGEIPLKELRAQLKETQPEQVLPEEPVPQEAEEIIIEDPAPKETEEVKPEPATPAEETEINEPEPLEEEPETKESELQKEADAPPKKSFKEKIEPFIQKATAVFSATKNLLKTIPKTAYLTAACAVFATAVILTTLAFRTVYTIELGETTATVRSFLTDTEKILQKAGLVYHEDSKIELTQSGRQALITVTEPFTVAFEHDGETTNVTTTGAYVDELLDMADITLGEFDTVSQPLNSYIEAADTVEVDRITFKRSYEEEIIPAPVEDQSDGADYTYTKEGVDGEALVTYLEKYINGKLIETTEIAREILSEAQATIILSMEHNGSLPQSTEIPTEYIRVMDIECTAYYLPGNYTATGKIAQRGYVAVDPSVIPLGTKMFICSADGSYIYGYAQAEDTGSAVKGNIVDLHMDSYEECLIFGRRDLIAYIIEE